MFIYAKRRFYLLKISAHKRKFPQLYKHRKKALSILHVTHDYFLVWKTNSHQLKCIKYIQKWWRSRPYDVISGTQVKRSFHIITNNITFVYDACTFREYIITSNKITDPITRRELFNCELMRLDRICGFRNNTLMLQKNQFSLAYKDRCETEGLVFCLEHELCEIINNLIEMQQDDFPHLYYQFTQAFHNLYNLSKNTALDTINCSIRRVKIEVIDDTYREKLETMVSDIKYSCFSC